MYVCKILTVNEVFSKLLVSLLANDHSAQISILAVDILYGFCVLGRGDEFLDLGLSCALMEMERGGWKEEGGGRREEGRGWRKEGREEMRGEEGRK